MRFIAYRVAAALAMLVFWLSGYNIVVMGLDPRGFYDVRTALDDGIPFLPWSVYAYSWVYTSMLYPAFVVRDHGLFRRIVVAYTAVIGVSLLCFAFFPVTALGFRPDAAVLDTSVFHEWGVRLTFTLDPPYNLLPSLHLSIAAIAALSAWKARRLYGVLAMPVVLGIAVSICTMKQHFIADGVTALMLAGTVYAFVLRPYRAGTAGSLAYSWRGPVAYLAFHSCVYLGFFIAFTAGFRIG